MTFLEFIRFYETEDVKAFNRMMMTYPHDDTPRYVFADWVQEREPELGLAIRRSLDNCFSICHLRAKGYHLRAPDYRLGIFRARLHLDRTPSWWDLGEYISENALRRLRKSLAIGSADFPYKRLKSIDTQVVKFMPNVDRYGIYRRKPPNIDNAARICLVRGDVADLRDFTKIYKELAAWLQDNPQSRVIANLVMFNSQQDFRFLRKSFDKDVDERFETICIEKPMEAYLNIDGIPFRDFHFDVGS